MKFFVFTPRYYDDLFSASGCMSFDSSAAARRYIYRSFNPFLWCYFRLPHSDGYRYYVALRKEVNLYA